MADALAITAVLNATSGFTLPGTVDVFDLTTNTPQAGSPYTVGIEPDSVSPSPDGRWFLITNGGGIPTALGSVQFIDTSTTPVTIQLPITVGNSPAGCQFSPDSQTAYVLNSYDGTIDVFDLISDTWTKRTGTGYPVLSSQAASPSFNVLWQNMVIFIDGIDGWWGLAPNELEGDGTTVDVFNLSALPPVLAYTITVGNAPAAVALMGTNVLVINGADNTVGVIDCTPLPSSPPVYGGSPIGVGNIPYWIQVNNAQTQAYVSNAGDNTIGVIDDTLTYLGPVSDVGSAINTPAAGGFSPDDSTYYACSAGNNAVVSIDTGTTTVTGSRGVGGLPAGLAVSLGTISHTGQGTMIAFA